MCNDTLCWVKLWIMFLGIEVDRYEVEEIIEFCSSDSDSNNLFQIIHSKSYDEVLCSTSEIYNSFW